MHMTVSIPRSKIPYGLFLLYFILYSASPLSFTFGDKRGMKRLLSGNASLSENVLHIFLLDAIFSGFSPEEEEKEDNADFKIFLRKLRAVISENKAVKLIDVDTITAGAVSERSPAFLFAYGTVPHHINELRNGFTPLYSGLSPPAAAPVV